MESKASAPIGIFDSGIGGLTVARDLVEQLPHENIVYFGDTAHLPYGDKSAAAIQGYALKIVEMLLHEGCKLILIACNSASVAAYDIVKEYVGARALVVNVIDPVIAYIGQHYANKKIGLIGTRQTVNSNSYQKKVDALGLNINLQAHATPLLAPAIEEGFAGKRVIDDILSEYLRHDGLNAIEALILGCTHYPIIEKQIKNFYHNNLQVLDTGKLIATAVTEVLTQSGLLRTRGKGSERFFVSDLTPTFVANTKLFFSDKVVLEHYPLWG